MSTGRHRVVPVLGVVLFAVTTLLLTSVGGLGIVAAPLTLPLLFLVVRAHPTRAFRITAAIIGGLTAAELGWGIVYVLVGEVPVAIWLVPVLCGAATAFVLTTRGQPQREQ